MIVLVTGSAGFIGFHVTLALLNMGHRVIGLDNINDYYDVQLKYGRLKEAGIDRNEIALRKQVPSWKYGQFNFIRMDLEDKEGLMELCGNYHFDVIINLAAQAGVRYSILNPDVYAQSNVVGFLNILEVCRKYEVGHLIYASSSSVYGLNAKVPFSVNDPADHPISLYAATKKANELMAHTYSHLYNIPTTGLRFFTVYGPWGRPDMAYFMFSEAIMSGKPVRVFNNGKMKRDFTYIDDVVNGILNVLERPSAAAGDWDRFHPDPSVSTAPYKIYNIGNNSPVELIRFLNILEDHLHMSALIEYTGMQQGDVEDTWADIEESIRDFDFQPKTSIQEGLKKFTDWYTEWVASSKSQYEDIRKMEVI
jgi:UDP-glucuronate 4-epimerase